MGLSVVVASADIHAKVWQSFEIQQLLRALKRQGIEISTLLAKSGLNEQLLSQPGQLLSLEQELSLYIAIAEHNQDPMLALEQGSKMGLNYQGVLGTLMLSSDSLSQAINYLQKYFALVSWTSFISIDNEKKHSVEMTMVPTPAGENTARFEVESAFASMQTLFRQITMSELTFKRVDFNFPLTVKKQAAFSRFFNCTVRGGRERNAIVIARKDFEQPLPAAEPNHILTLENLCQRNLEVLKEDRGLLAAVKRQLMAQDGVYPSIEEVAGRFHQSGRTLRRKLAELGSSYQKLLEQVRFEKAKQLLMHSDLTIDNIAHELAYSDSRSFRFAFKRWANVTPAQFRNNR